MFRTTFLINLAEISAIFGVTHFSIVQSAIAKRWGGLRQLVKYVCATTVDATAAMEKRGLYTALGAFKDVEGILPYRIRGTGTWVGQKVPYPVSKKLQRM